MFCRNSCASERRALEAAEGPIDCTLALDAADTVGSRMVDAVEIGLSPRRPLLALAAAGSSADRSAAPRARSGTRGEEVAWERGGNRAVVWIADSAGVPSPSVALPNSSGTAWRRELSRRPWTTMDSRACIRAIDSRCRFRLRMRRLSDRARTDGVSDVSDGAVRGLDKPTACAMAAAVSVGCCANESAPGPAPAAGMADGGEGSAAAVAAATAGGGRGAASCTVERRGLASGGGAASCTVERLVRAAEGSFRCTVTVRRALTRREPPPSDPRKSPSAPALELVLAEFGAEDSEAGADEVAILAVFLWICTVARRPGCTETRRSEACPVDAVLWASSARSVPTRPTPTSSSQSRLKNSGGPAVLVRLRPLLAFAGLSSASDQDTFGGKHPSTLPERLELALPASLAVAFAAAAARQASR